MNLIQKLQHYYHLRKFNIRNAWIKSPLTDADYWGITMIVCIFLIALVLFKAESIDKSLTEHKSQAIRAKNALQLANLTIDKQEKVIISMLNGSYFENGRIKTICVINAAGECE